MGSANDWFDVMNPMKKSEKQYASVQHQATPQAPTRQRYDFPDPYHKGSAKMAKEVTKPANTAGESEKSDAEPSPSSSSSTSLLEQMPGRGEASAFEGPIWWAKSQKDWMDSVDPTKKSRAQ